MGLVIPQKTERFGSQTRSQNKQLQTVAKPKSYAATVQQIKNE